MGKQVKMDASVYYSENSRRIHIFVGSVRATVSGEPERVNYHPELFRKLGAMLREAGKPAPEQEPADSGRRRRSQRTS